MFETWLELSPEFKFPFSHIIIRRIWINSVASLSYISSSWQAKRGVIVNSFYQSIWPKLNLQLTSIVRSFAFPQLSRDLSTGAKAEAEGPSGRLPIQCERPVYKQTAAMGLNETNIPREKKTLRTQGSHARAESGKKSRQLPCTYVEKGNTGRWQSGCS